MFVPLVDNGKTDTAVGIIGNSDVAFTLQGGNFGSPTYKIWLCLEPTSATLAEWAYCTVSGTAVSQMVRPNPKTHTTGCEVRWVHPADSINNLLLFMEDGWTVVPPHVTATYASATTFTLAGDWTSVLSKGDKLRLTNTTTKYFYVRSTSFGSGVTTVTVTGGSDYSLASGAITAVYYSKAASPAGHPIWFGWQVTYSAGGSMTFTSVVTDYAAFRMNGAEAEFKLKATGTTGGTASSQIMYSLPPVTPSATPTLPFTGWISDSGNLAGFAYLLNSTTGGINKYNDSSYNLGASKVIQVSGSYAV